jgi:hypothetical protein
MATRIVFSGGEEGSVRVTETPDQVQSKLVEGRRTAVLLEHQDHGPIYVNPANINYWHAAPDKPPSS